MLNALRAHGDLTLPAQLFREVKHITGQPDDLNTSEAVRFLWALAHYHADGLDVVVTPKDKPSYTVNQPFLAEQLNRYNCHTYRSMPIFMSREAATDIQALKDVFDLPSDRTTIAVALTFYKTIRDEVKKGSTIELIGGEDTWKVEFDFKENAVGACRNISAQARSWFLDKVIRARLFLKECAFF